MKPKVYFAEDHGIDPDLIDPDALSVLQKLQNAGYTAYLVGGSVRDLLIKEMPKDYDISTSAQPEQVKALFGRQCLLIGRRFRLAHVRFGHKVIEVATFRAGENDSDLITQDNIWGTEEEDVLRRDFTINGLYYDSSNHSILDYVGGWEDLKAKTLRCIGEPVTRFKQDPVRILRLLKFHARFQFEIDTATHQAAYQCRKEITKSSPARILEEILKMLESGYAAPFIRVLAEHEILELLFPSLARFLKVKEGKLIYRYLACADQLNKANKKHPFDRAVLSACLLFPIFESALEKHYLSNKKIPHLGEITVLASTLVREIFVQAFSHFPRRISSAVIALIVAQYRFTPLSGRRHYPEKFFHHKEFPLALQFFKVRALIDEKYVDIYISIRNQYKELMHQGGRKHHPSPQRRPRRRYSPTKKAE